MKPPAPRYVEGRASGGDALVRRLSVTVGVLAVLLIGVVVYAWTRGGNEASFNPIARAAVRTQRASGGRTAFHATVRAHSLPHAIAMSGQGVFNGRTNRSRLTLEVPTPAGEFEMEGVGSGSHFYLRSEQLKSGLPEGDEWLGLDMSLGSSSETGAVANADPSAQLAVLRAVSDKVEEIGKKRVRGIETTGYRSALDAGSYARYLRRKGSVKAANQYERLAKAVPSATEVETWIDGKGLVRRTEMTVDSHDPSSGEATTMEMTIDFYDFGISPDVRLPDPATVYDATPTVRSGLGLRSSD